ncbi:AAA family ATPase [Cytobacillus oceanisediminis]|uniref:AAA family ATPase n=1 Tax=Cytobacillus TaxID=2675230 RepID=UPI001C24A41E|nr:AAA family ATPase [Cytobacillus oceanisediminis]MBU8733464.1 AAA family ATPase [Cytobacillus oceanisediminis]
MHKKLSLLSLHLKNFKGVQDFILDARGENVKVFGDNATGKTTLFDAFIWLLFDKDSQNKKDFSIKTLRNGKEIHNLEHEVEGVFLLDDKQLILRKVFTEKWTKKRGSANAEFTGHTTDYFIDGVPSKKKEYMDLVDSIVQEDIFKLLTSPSYFNEQLKKEERRKILMEVCGDISDEEVIASDSALSKLPSILNGLTIEKYKKIIAARRTEINKELDKIPVRISEVQRSLPQLEGLDKSGLEMEIAQINAAIDEKMTQISSIRNGKAISDKQKAIQEIEMDLIQIKRDHDSVSKDQVYQLKAKIQEEQSNVSILNSKLENLKSQKRYNDQNIKSIEENLVQLRSEWHEINSHEFTYNDQCECPACGQALPEEQVESAREKALAQFNLNKSNKLEDINKKGKEGSERKQEIVQNNESLAKEYEKLSEQINEKQEKLTKLQNQLKQQESLVTDVLDNPAYTSKLQEKQNVENEINDLRQMSESAVQDIQVEIIELREKRDALQADLGKFMLSQQLENRISDLEEQERELSAEYEKLEHELYLTEQFIRTKVNLLEEKINSRFKYARFNLFKQNINGGLEEICDTTYLGVPYASGLNNAAKINVGLDIINTLSEHYGFYAPIFIDNSEAVTKLIETNSQTVSLVVSERDKKLRVEYPEQMIEEAI